MKDPQWSTAKNWMSFGDIIYMAQLTTVETRGITVVYSEGLDVIGNYCDIIYLAQLTTVEQEGSQQSAAGNGMSLEITATFIIWES